jgi:two-component system, cell cycle response regulator
VTTNSKITTVVTAVSRVQQALKSQAALVLIHGDPLGLKFDLPPGTTSIGRSSKNDLTLDHDAVSRVHAYVERRGDSCLLRDAGSTNGTWVNDEPVSSGDRLLVDGDLIKVGRAVLKFLSGSHLESAYHEEIYRLTTVDGLTQVANRRFFEETLERELSRGRRYHRGLALVMFDLDFFKAINDQHGHLAGDAVLKEVASLARSKVRREDVLARYGGEEFAIVLPEIRLAGAKAMAEKLRALVEDHVFSFDGVDIEVTISVGVAEWKGPDERLTSLVARCDQSLYEAKERGRNRVRAAR